MKHFFLTASFVFAGLFTQAQNAVPSVELKTLDGKTLNITEVVKNDGNPVLISFWATWCKPCKLELNTINEVYADWQDETGVKLVAISIDDSRMSSRVKPYVNSVGWEYDVLLDANGDLKRAMNVNTIPHTFLLDGKGNVVWQHNGYTPGDEDELIELIKKVAKGESIKH
jgi:thiol-disulfide isomerase/thioredoxin